MDKFANPKAPSGALQMSGDPDTLLAEYDAVDEKPELAVIHPGDSPEEAELEPFADDCVSESRIELSCIDQGTDDAMRARYLPELPDLEAADEATSTWTIDRYRSLQTKERGPIFTCGGHPWCAHLINSSS